MKTTLVPLHLPVAKLEPYIIGELQDRDVVSFKVDQSYRWLVIKHRALDRNG